MSIAFPFSTWAHYVVLHSVSFVCEEQNSPTSKSSHIQLNFCLTSKANTHFMVIFYITLLKCLKRVPTLTTEQKYQLFTHRTKITNVKPHLLLWHMSQDINKEADPKITKSIFHLPNSNKSFAKIFTIKLQPKPISIISNQTILKLSSTSWFNNPSIASKFNMNHPLIFI